MESTLFDSLYKKLNTEQKKAVDSIEGSVMVIAGPGTGKTQILTLRIAHILLKTQSNPENILVLTFTESAAYEMRKRLVEIIGSIGYRVQINTFHGFCNELIQKHSDQFSRLVNANGIEELEQFQIVESILNQNDLPHLRPFNAPLYYIKPILEAISQLKKEGIGEAQFSLGLEKQKKDFDNIVDLYHEKGKYIGKMKGKYHALFIQLKRNSELIIVYRLYEEELRKRNKYDFNDMLLEVIHNFEKNEEFLLEIQELYQYFLIDEHQDTNAAQNKIIRLLCGYYENPNLFIVGDEKQAIYRFQGASLENFLYFKNLYKEAILINLNQNYRSTQSILDSAGSLIRHTSQGRLLSNSILLSQNKHKEYPVQVAHFNQYYAEYFYIAKEIQKKILQGVSPREIVILIRNNKDMLPLIEVFQHKKIPYVTDTAENIFDDLYIQKLISIFHCLYYFGEDKLLIETMHINTFSIHSFDIYQLMQKATTSKMSFWEICLNNDLISEMHFQKKESITSLIKLLIKWNIQATNDSFDNVFIDILNQSKILQAVLKDKNSIAILRKITILYNEVKKAVSLNHLYKLKDFIDYYTLLLQHKVILRTSQVSIFQNGVRIMTAHRAKGLEFDYVYIINVYNGHWGNKRSKGNLFQLPWEFLSIVYDSHIKEEENEDERRLFYVALTRARKEVLMSYSDFSLEGKEQTVSQFITEIDSELKQERNVSEFEQHFNVKPEIILFEKPRINKKEKELLYVKNKDFFWDIFTFRGLSVSGLNNYLKCPWRYFFRNLLQLPDIKNISMIFGSAIHHALNAYLITLHNRKVDFSYILEQYHQALLKQPLNEKEFTELLKKGEVVLSGYYKEKAREWHKGMGSEVEIKGIRFDDGVFLNGKIDMIEKNDKIGNVTVYDFKTGKPKTRNYIEGKSTNSTGDYKRQLVFYKILLERFKEGRHKMKVEKGVIEFIEPDDKGEYHSELFEILQSDVFELEKVIRRIAGEIKTLNFWDKRCEDTDCVYCKMRTYLKG